MCLLSMARHFSAIDCWANVLNPCGDSMMASRRETLCLIRPRLSIPNCFVRTYELAFSLYGRNSTTQRNGMPCAVIDFSYHSWEHSRRIHWNAQQHDDDDGREIRSHTFDFCAHIGLTAGLDMNETPRRVGDAPRPNRHFIFVPIWRRRNITAVGWISNRHKKTPSAPANNSSTSLYVSVSDHM